MSAELQWLLTKKSNVFVLNRRNTGTKKLTTELNNVTGVHAFRFSGLVHSKTVAIDETAEKKGAVLTVKRVKPSAAFRLGKGVVRVSLKKHARAGVKTVRAYTNKYRPDLTKVALQKWTKIAASQRRAAAPKKVVKA